MRAPLTRSSAWLILGVRFSRFMKSTRDIVAEGLLWLAIASLMAGMVSGWYLWYMASRVSDPGRGLIYPRSLGEFDQITVYLSSAESVLLSPEVYLGGSVLLALLAAAASRKGPLHEQT